jgi:hypothetical protein
MTFADLALGASVFLDANTLLYHFTADAQFGAACRFRCKCCEKPV